MAEAGRQGGTAAFARKAAGHLLVPHPETSPQVLTVVPSYVLLLVKQSKKGAEASLHSLGTRGK